MTRSEWGRRPSRVSYARRYPSRAREIRERDHGKCVYCGDAGTTFDHLTPKSRGGSDLKTNMVCACLSCNSRRGNMSLPSWCAIWALDPRALKRRTQ